MRVLNGDLTLPIFLNTPIPAVLKGSDFLHRFGTQFGSENQNYWVMTSKIWHRINNFTRIWP